MAEKTIQLVNNVDKHPLLSNEQAIVHYPDKFVLDFKQITHQSPPQSEPMIVACHKVVLLDPHVAKSFLNTLKENIAKYEEKFGKIKEPKSVQQARENEKKKIPTKTEKPSYLG